MNGNRPLYWRPLALALLLTIAIPVVSKYLLPGIPMLMYFNELINQRDVVPYGIIFFGFSVALCALVAIRHEDYRPRMPYLFLAMSFMPLVIGVVGWQMRLAAIRTWYRTEMATSPSYEKLVEIEIARSEAAYIAFDDMWFALVFFAMALSASFNHWAYVSVRREKTQARPVINARVRILKAWAAYFSLHFIISFIIGIIYYTMIQLFYHLVLEEKAGAPQSVILIIAVLISAVISYLVFRLVYKNMILPRANGDTH